MEFWAKLCLLFNMVFGLVVLNTIATVFTDITHIVRGSWDFNGLSAPVVLFIGACISVTHDILTIITGFEIIKTKYFVAFHAVMVLFYLGAVIACLFLVTSEEFRNSGPFIIEMKRSITAGSTFGILTGISQAFTSAFSRASM